MTPFEQHFLRPRSIDVYRETMHRAIDAVSDRHGTLEQVYSGKSPADQRATMKDLEICPERPVPAKDVMRWVSREILEQSMVVADPTCIAHLHCPPLIPAVAAEAMISATNQSMDSWDQAPAATYLEQAMTDWLCRLYKLGSGADGIFTSGGTQSNLMGLLLARDACAKARNERWNIQVKGLPEEAWRYRILCSQASHFSVRQAAAILGLGHDAVVPIETDKQHRMNVDALYSQIIMMSHRGFIPMAIVATAGTTDFGSIDPLPEIAEIAKSEQIWLHVDAAYAGALALSKRHARKLRGIEHADSITVDFHKLFYQPISCGAFLVKHRQHFGHIRLNADYLNPQSNEEDDILDLVGKSIQTTRRFDGLKLFMSLQMLGRAELAAMIEGTIDLARNAAALIAADRRFKIANRKPALNAVVFRHRPDGLSEEAADAVNLKIRARLLKEGRANLAQTRIDGRIYLKMTLLNPTTELHHVSEILDLIVEWSSEKDGRDPTSNRMTAA